MLSVVYVMGLSYFGNSTKMAKHAPFPAPMWHINGAPCITSIAIEVTWWLEYDTLSLAPVLLKRRQWQPFISIPRYKNINHHAPSFLSLVN